MTKSEAKSDNYLHRARLLLGKPIDWGFALFMATLFGSMYYWFQYPIPLEPIPAFVNLEKSSGAARIESTSRSNILHIDADVYLCSYSQSAGATGFCLLDLRNMSPLPVTAYWYWHRTSGGKKRLLMHVIRSADQAILLNYDDQKNKLITRQTRSPLITPGMLLLQSILIFFVTFSVTLFISRGK